MIILKSYLFTFAGVHMISVLETVTAINLELKPQLDYPTSLLSSQISTAPPRPPSFPPCPPPPSFCLLTECDRGLAGELR